MKVYELIELLQKEDQDAEVVVLDNRCYFSIVNLRKMYLEPTLVRDPRSNELFPGYRETMKNDKEGSYIELRRG